MFDEHDVMNLALIIADRFSKSLEDIDKEKYPIVWNIFKERNDAITMFLSQLSFEINQKREKLNVSIN